MWDRIERLLLAVLLLQKVALWLMLACCCSRQLRKLLQTRANFSKRILHRRRRWQSGVAYTIAACRVSTGADAVSTVELKVSATIRWRKAASGEWHARTVWCTEKSGAASDVA